MDPRDFLLIAIVVLLAHAVWMLYRISGWLHGYKGPKWPTVDTKGNIVAENSAAASHNPIMPRSHKAGTLAAKVEYLACGPSAASWRCSKRLSTKPE